MQGYGEVSVGYGLLSDHEALAVEHDGVDTVVRRETISGHREALLHAQNRLSGVDGTVVVRVLEHDPARVPDVRADEAGGPIARRAYGHGLPFLDRFRARELQIRQ